MINYKKWRFIKSSLIYITAKIRAKIAKRDMKQISNFIIKFEKNKSELEP